MIVFKDGETAKQVRAYLQNQSLVPVEDMLMLLAREIDRLWEKLHQLTRDMS